MMFSVFFRKRIIIIVHTLVWFLGCIYIHSKNSDHAENADIFFVFCFSSIVHDFVQLFMVYDW